MLNDTAFVSTLSGSPMMSPHPGASPYPRHSWEEEGSPGDHGQPDGFPPKGSHTSGINSPDPYAFPPSSGDPFSPPQIRPGAMRPPHRLPGLQTFTPRNEEGMFNAPGMGPRMRPNADPFSGPGQDMFIGGSRRMPGRLIYESLLKLIFVYHMNRLVL